MTITLYMLNGVTGDMHGATVKCWPVVAERWAAGDRHQNYACPDALTASPPSPSFPRSPPGLSVAGPVVQRDTAASLYSGPVTGRSVN